MVPFSKKEKLNLLSKLYWDSDVNKDYLFDILDENKHAENEIDLIILYQRLLNTFDWYTLLKLIPEKSLKFALEDNVLKHLYPKDVYRRFKYARIVLSSLK